MYNIDSTIVPTAGGARVGNPNYDEIILVKKM